MTKRGSPAVQVLAVIAVVGIFLYGFYRYHDQHTRLKRSEESADKLQQKSESLSAQLQGVTDCGVGKYRKLLKAAITKGRFW